VGTAAVQLGVAAGITVYVTAGSQEKIDVAKGLGAKDGANYKDGSFVDKIQNFTNGRGVDVVLDCVGGSYWQQNSDVLAMDGRWVIYGTMGGIKVEGDLIGRILRKRLALVGSTLRARSVEYKSKLVSSFSDVALDKFGSGAYRPIIAQVFPLSDLAGAHRLMESNANTGKIIIEVIPEGKKSEL